MRIIEAYACIKVLGNFKYWANIFGNDFTCELFFIRIQYFVKKNQYTLISILLSYKILRYGELKADR
jgi:hypothetical protein